MHMKNCKRDLCILIFAVLLVSNFLVLSVFADGDTEVDYDRISEQIEADIKRNHIPGMSVIVVDKDSVLFQDNYGNCQSADTPFIIGSMSKSFTALAIVQLAERGKVDLDKPISDYVNVTEYFIDASDPEKITIRNLLNHTSGIETYQTFGNLKSTDSYGKHVYANANYGLLGLIIEEVSGISYEEYVTEYIFKPLGMAHAAADLENAKANGLIDGYRNYFGFFVPGEPDYPTAIKSGTWINIPAGYISASATDMGKYLQMYLNGGNGIVREESINIMFYDGVPSADGTYDYGMGWQYTTEVFSRPMLWHAGLVENYISYMFIIPEEGIAVAVLVNMNDYLVGNNIIGNIIMPLLGEQRKELPDLYLILHVAIDAVYLLLCLISVLGVLSLRKYDKKKHKYVLECFRHIILPMLLLLIPAIAKTPISVIWLFVKDLFLVLYINAAVLIVVGGIKLFLICKTAPRKCIESK